jgi:UPF0755 protein
MKRKYLILFYYLCGLIVIIVFLFIYRLLFGLNVKPEGRKVVIYIPENSSYFQAMDSVEAHLQIRNIKILKWIAVKKKYPRLVKPGKYIIDRDLSYNELINLLRTGRQNPVNVTFNNIRTLNELAGKIGKQINADSAQIIQFLSNPENYSKDGFTPENVISVFIPNTYQFFWNTTAS